MKLSHARIIGLSVKTQSGQVLGKVSDFMIEMDTGRLEILEVRPGGFLHGLIDQHLLIRWSQVVSMSATEVIVEDGVVPIGAQSIAVHSVSPTVPPAV